MAGEASAFAVLGLKPGADWASIDQAYKRLIKLHHPDREGGDAARAAEINRAYRELKGARGLDEAVPFNEPPAATAQPARWGCTAAALVLVVGLMVLPTLSDTPLIAPLPFGATAPGPDRAASHQRQRAPDVMDQPLHWSVIDDSVQRAVHLASTSDEMALAAASRDCQRQLRSRPSLPQLDRCAAFDAAVVQLQDRDPLRDQGPFSEIAVTGRIWSGATALSDDSLAIDARIDRIRRRVEVALQKRNAPNPATAN